MYKTVKILQFFSQICWLSYFLIQYGVNSLIHMQRKDGNNSLMLLSKASHSRRKVLFFFSGEDTLKRNPSMFGFLNVIRRLVTEILILTSKTLEPLRLADFAAYACSLFLSCMNTG